MKKLWRERSLREEDGWMRIVDRDLIYGGDGRRLEKVFLGTFWLARDLKNNQIRREFFWEVMKVSCSKEREGVCCGNKIRLYVRLVLDTRHSSFWIETMVVNYRDHRIILPWARAAKISANSYLYNTHPDNSRIHILLKCPWNSLPDRPHAQS